MSIYELCEVNEISQLLGLPFGRALALYRTVEREGHAKPVPAIVPARSPFIGSLEVVL